MVYHTEKLLKINTEVKNLRFQANVLNFHIIKCLMSCKLNYSDNIFSPRIAWVCSLSIVIEISR